MAKVKEAPEDLQRQKEDIENLLSSLETAFKEGTITQEHYNEVRQKNAEKLEEVKKKLQQAERQVQKEAEKEESKEAPKEQEPSKKEEKEEKKSEEKEKAEGRRQESPSGQKEPAVSEVPAGISKEMDEATQERIKEKIIMELTPKLEKMNVRMVKLKAFVDALKEDKTGERESSQHLTEEIGESRSTINTMESRVGEMEMKLEDVSETLADLKPQRFSKELQKKEEELKMHEARLEKLDDMVSTILKRVNQTQIILEKLGNIESIATMTKDISKKMVSIDDREKKITRLADKIDSMFVEINKRLEEFMFYKAKQDSLDDLSKEMLKSIDEFSTKLTRYAEKDDMELLRDTLENKINAMMKESPVSAVPAQFRQDKGEIESLMKLLDEQFKKGLMSKKDYEKAREANLNRLKEMEGSAQIPLAAPASAPPEEPAEIPATPPEKKPEKVPEAESGLAQAAKMTQPPSQAEVPKEEKKPAAKKKEPEASEKLEKKKEPSEEKTGISKDDIMKKIAGKPNAEGGKGGKKQKMLADLEDSFRKGLISQKAYESTQKIIMSRKI